MRRALFFASIAILVAATGAEAGGWKHRRGCGRSYRSAYSQATHAYPQVTYAYPQATYAYSPPVAYAPAPAPAAVAYPSNGVAEAPASAIALQPSYEYQAEPGGRAAYYYTYDNSGKLIIQQWGDWLFRGGREAGMPRPPMPIVGRLQGR